MAAIKTISMTDDSLWARAVEVSKGRYEGDKGNVSRLIRDLLHEECVVKERQRTDRLAGTPAARIRLAADALEKQASALRQAADLLEQSS